MGVLQRWENGVNILKGKVVARLISEFLTESGVCVFIVVAGPCTEATWPCPMCGGYEWKLLI